MRAIVARGSFESEKLDDFGLASLGELRELVPSVVEVDRRDEPKSLDREALQAFLRYAETDPARATIGPARDEVELIERVLERAEARPDTRLPAARTTAGRYVRAVEGDLRGIWPSLARQLRRLRDRL